MIVPGYEPLASVLQLALDQAQSGKGKERHGNDKPFLQQPTMEIGRMVGTGYCVGQAMKKSHESMRLPLERSQAELLGAINYLASAYLLIDEKMHNQKADELVGRKIAREDREIGTITPVDRIMEPGATK